MSLLDQQPKEALRVKLLTGLQYKPLRATNCQTHHLAREVTCLQTDCPMSFQLHCRECHPDKTHSILSVNRAVPKIVQMLSEEWSQILREHKAIESEWKHCLVNLDYCIEILSEVKSQILERSQSASFLIFNQLLSQSELMMKHQGDNATLEGLLRTIERLHKKHNILQAEEKPARCPNAEKERNHLKNQAKQAAHKTKTFSESALIFSEQLASIIQQKLKFQRRVGRLKQLTQHRVFSLKDLLKEEHKPEEVGEVLLDLSKGKGEEEIDVGEVLRRCQNMKALRITSRGSGGPEREKWKGIINGMEGLAFLKQLYLNIRGCDLPFLTQLFQQRSKAVRQVEKLTLIITDQKQLSTKEVCAFVNTMELRSLHMNLSRDNLDREQATHLLKNLRLSTSMTGLPLSQFSLNLSKNKIAEQVPMNSLFSTLTAKIKEKSFTL